MRHMLFFDSMVSTMTVSRCSAACEIVTYTFNRSVRAALGLRLSCSHSMHDVSPVRSYHIYPYTELSRLTLSAYLDSLAFVTLQNNLMVLSLRAMITQFTVLMLIAAFCFGGFLYALWT